MTLGSTSLDNIPRIDPIAGRDFIEDYLRPPRPVVVRNLHAGTPIGRLTTMEEAAAALGHMPVPVQLEYTTRSFVRRVDKEIRIMPLGEFLARPEDDPERRLLVVGEQPIDELPEMAGWVQPPAWTALAGALADDLVCKVFVAHQGHYAHMHYDLDGRAVLLTQVFGRKRVIVVPPERGALLDPMVDGPGHWSSLFVENLSDEEKLHLVRMLGAHDCILEPGDTLFIPTAWWHYVDYLTTGMGFNIRLGRTPRQARLLAIGEALAPRHVHYWQGIAQVFATGREPPDDVCARADALLEAFDEACAGEREAVGRYGQLLVDLYRDACPDGFRTVVYADDLLRAGPIPAPRVASAHAWGVDDRAALADGIELAETLGVGDSRQLLVLMDGRAALRIEAGEDPDTFRVSRQLLELLGAAPDGLIVAALQRQLECDLAQLLDLLADLSDVGCVRPCQRR